MTSDTRALAKVLSHALPHKAVRRCIALFQGTGGSYHYVCCLITGGGLRYESHGCLETHTPGGAGGGYSSVILSLPLQQILLRHLALPTTSPTQVEKAMPFEISAFSPWPMEECISSFETCRVDDDGYSHVLAAVARADDVSAHVDALARLGLEVTRVEPLTQSLTRLAERAGWLENTIAIVAESSGLNYLRMREARLAFSRGAPMEERPHEAIQRSFELDLRRNGEAAHPAALIVTGGACDNAQRCEAAAQLGLPQSALLENLPAVMENPPPGGAPNPVCAGAVLAATQDGTGLNLLPAPHVRKQQLRRIAHRARVTVMLATACLLIATGTLYFLLDFETRRADQLEARIAEFEREVGNLKERSEAVSRLDDERMQVSMPLRFMLDLYQLTPASVGLSSLHYKKSGEIVLGGEAPAYPIIYEFLDKLLQSGRFERVDMKYGAMPQAENGKNLVDFKVTCTLR